MHIDLNACRKHLQDALQQAKDSGYKPMPDNEYEIFNELMPLLLELRNEGYSYFQIADLLTKAGFNFVPGTIRANFEFLIHKRIFQNMLVHEEQTKLLEDLLNILTKQIPSFFPKSSGSALSSTQAGNWKCLPLPDGVKSLPIRNKVPPDVYENGILEHPAIPGLMLTKEERIFGEYLEMIEKVSGQARTESVKERIFRIKWEKPIPRSESLSGKVL
jgi:hypothetical protein